MRTDGEQVNGNGAIDESQSIDWFANVVESSSPEDSEPTETAMPEDHSSVDSELHGSAGDLSDGKVRRIGSQAIESYQRLPSWVLLPQIFLAFGWARAGVAHALSRRWWNGEEILEFLATDTELHVGLYRPVLTGIVEPFPAAVAVGVVLAELVIAVMLLTNYRVKVALVAAAFLNVQFILAGVVNPSIFYLVASLGIAIWRLETTASAETTARLTRVGLPLAFGGSLLLAPSVRTIKPETAIEDPALVLIFLMLLTAASLWWANRRTALASNTLTELIGDHGSGSHPRKTPISIVWLTLAVVATAVLLLAGYVVSSDDDVLPGETVASAESAELGSLGQPYAFGQDVTLSYDDFDTGAMRQWQVQVLDALLLHGARLGLTPPNADSRLAIAQIQLTYPTPAGPAADLRFSALDQSGQPIPATTEGCGERAPLQSQDLDTATSGELTGWVCWWVTATDLRSVLLAVEAEPADGTVYMSLSKE